MPQEFSLYQYDSHEEYKNAQAEGNKRKISSVWALEKNIKHLSKILKKREPKFGICHGTRRGVEQSWFRKYLGCEVIGTEISDTAEQFPHTIEWDFHEVKPEWLGNVDFIYSNSFDHSYDPEKCLNAWMSCLSSNGVCILEHTSLHSEDGVSRTDPFGASLEVMPELIEKWGAGKYRVADIKKTPKKHKFVKYSSFIFIENQ